MNNDIRIIVNQFSHERRWTLLRCDDINPILCSRQGNIEQSTFFCKFNSIVFVYNKFQYRIILNSRRESKFGIYGIYDDHIVISETFRFMNGHIFIVEILKCFRYDNAHLLIIFEVGRST